MCIYFECLSREVTVLTILRFVKPHASNPLEKITHQMFYNNFLFFTFCLTFQHIFHVVSCDIVLLH